MSRSFISYDIEFRKFLVPNPLDNEYVVPLYVRMEYDTLHIDYHNIEWAYYVLEFDHRQVRDGKWVLSNIKTDVLRREAKNKGYEVFGFPEFTVMYFIAYANLPTRKEVEILGGFSLVRNPSDVINMPSTSAAHSDRMINFSRFCDYHPFGMRPNLTVHGKYMMRIYSFGYVYHKHMDGVLGMISPNETHIDYNDLSKRCTKWTSGDLHTVINTAYVIEGGFRGDTEPEHSYHFNLDSQYDPQNPLSAWRYLHQPEGGKEPVDPYTNILNGMRGILDTDTESLSSPTTTILDQSEFSSQDLDAFLYTDDLDLSIYKDEETLSGDELDNQIY